MPVPLRVLAGDSCPVLIYFSLIINLAAQHIVVKGGLVRAQRVVDKVGEHMLVLSRKTGPSPSEPSDRDEYHELNAVYYGSKDGRWQTEWTVRA